jgi:hypothetical protein
MKRIKVLAALVTGVMEMRKNMGLLALFLIALVVLALALPALPGRAEEFDEAHIFFELNDTDGDLGIHALIDGDAYDKLQIIGPDKHKMLNLHIKGSLREQGLTEFFFESAEPTFDELSPGEFFDRFAEGDYTIKATTLEGDALKSETELTHTMPAPPGGIQLSGVPIDLDDVDCDDETTIPSVMEPVTISWEEVTMSHPDPDGGGAGVQPPIAVTIHNYEVVVEATVEVNGEEFDSVFSVVLPPGVTSMTVPAEFIDQAEEFKYEILAREESFNQTAIESCFVVVEP